MLHDEPIYYDGKIVGRTTSGNYSFNFKKNIAFGYINFDTNIGEKNLEIEIELDSFRGGLILIDDRNDACIPVWIGKKVSLMINESEQIILRAIRGLEITINEEE
jgi:hypothetical protein